MNAEDARLVVRMAQPGGQGSGEPVTAYPDVTRPLYPTPRFEKVVRTEPSFRYKLVRFLSAVGAFFSVPGMIALIVSAVKAPQLVFGTSTSTLAFLGSLVQLALAIPIYRAIKQRRRAGFMALLFAQGGTIIQQLYFALFKTPNVGPGQSVTLGGQAVTLALSLIWLGILISIKDELDQ